MIINPNPVSIVVVTETADHEFPTMQEAGEWLASMGYAQAAPTTFEIETQTGGTITDTEYERDQCGMETVDLEAHLTTYQAPATNATVN